MPGKSGATTVNRAVRRAKAVLNDRSLTFSDIALICGFADQSHFTRVFRREIGVSPGRWRRGV